MMCCEVIRDLLPLYVDELTSPQTNQQIEAHIKCCPECTKILEQLRNPIETSPSENDNYIKALRKQLQKKRIQTICIFLLVPILILILWWVYMQAHFAVFTSKVESTNPAFILKKEPRAELTQAEIELAQALFSHPIIQGAFTEDEPVQVSPTLLTDVLSLGLPESASVTTITLLNDYVILYYEHNGTRFSLEYNDADHTGFVDLICKTVATPEKNGEVKVFYTAKYHTATKNTEYERWVTSRNWFSFWK